VEPRELFSTSEAAAECGVDKSQIGRWRRAGAFPKPLVKLAAGPVWEPHTIRAFRAAREVHA
jgi:hypothetical protein